MTPKIEHASPYQVPSAFQLRLDCLPEAQVILGNDGAILFANVAARTLLEAADPADLRTRVRGWFDAATLAEADSHGVCCFDREYLLGAQQTVPLRVRLHGFVAATLPGARYLALLELLQPDASVIGGLAERQHELERALARLQNAQDQLLQADKMASIGQLAAGVAHEINNPIGYIYSNLGTLSEYISNLFLLIEVYEDALREAHRERPQRWVEIEDLKQRIDYEFLVKDLPQLLAESREGIERVRKIVADLRDFSRAGYAEKWTLADVHRGLDSTLNIVWNDLKYKCDVERRYGDLPQIECRPSQLNQVFLNILVNAGHAIEKRGTITVTTGCDGNGVFVDIADSGKGIAPENLGRIFDPFFTTKPVGQGTGLGLSLSYGIVREHGGRIEVHSQVGLGTTFRVFLPLHHQHDESRNEQHAAPEHP